MARTAHVRWCGGNHDDIGDCVIERTDRLSVDDRVRFIDGQDEFVGTVTGFDRDGNPYVAWDDTHRVELTFAEDVQPDRQTPSEAADDADEF